MEPYTKPIEEMSDDELQAAIAELRRQRRTGMSIKKKKAVKTESKAMDKKIDGMSDDTKSKLAEALAKKLGVNLNEL